MFRVRDEGTVKRIEGLAFSPQPLNLSALCFPFCVGDSAVLAKESVLNSQPFDFIFGVGNIL